MTSLPTIGWAAELKQDDRDLLASYGDFIPASADTVLIHEGEVQNNLYIVVSGSLKVVREVHGQLDVVAIVRTGESLGEIGVFERGLASATVIAVEFSQIWKISRDQLSVFMEDNPGAANKLLLALVRLLASRLRKSGSTPIGQG